MAIKDYVSCIKSAFIPERKSYTKAGYIIRLPRPECEWIVPAMIVIGAVSVGFILWLANTPNGQALAYRIGDMVATGR